MGGFRIAKICYIVNSYCAEMVFFPEVFLAHFNEKVNVMLFQYIPSGPLPVLPADDEEISSEDDLESEGHSHSESPQPEPAIAEKYINFDMFLHLFFFKKKLFQDNTVRTKTS